MKCKNVVYAKTEVPTIQKIKEYIDNGYFFRFQNSHVRLTSNSKSFPMCYSTATEAKKAGERVINGKSCTDRVSTLKNWQCEFNNDDVILIFEGNDTRETTDDYNEICATFYKSIAVWSMEDYLNIVPIMEHEVIRMREEKYNETQENYRSMLDLGQINL